jgi:hypothetical protein
VDPHTVTTLPGVTSTDRTLDDTRREWVSFDHDGDTWMFDATFLMSNWTCIFNDGCKGVHEEDTTELGHGCCSFGAHFADKPDRKRTRRAAERLTASNWQFHDRFTDLDRTFLKDDEGTWTTRVHDGACVFLNRTDFGRGAGCAFHVAALDAGERPLDWKPEVCWQVPIRFEYHDDELGHTTHVLREWKRRDWGEGGDEFHWWCTDAPEAFVGGAPVVLELRDDIVSLVGETVYEQLLVSLGVRATERPGTGGGETWLPHPAIRRRD